MNFVKSSIYIELFFIVFTTFLIFKNTCLQAQEITDSEIPLIYVTGFNGCSGLNTSCTQLDEDIKKTASIKVVDNATGLNNINGPYTLEGFVGIEFRGDTINSTDKTVYDKRSFSVETRDINGNDFNVKLLGFPLENDWIFQGPYIDKSLVRNALVYDLVREMGWYAPRAKFFNLVKDKAELDFSGGGYPEIIFKPVYEGVYVLLERIKRDDDRVDISVLNQTEIELPGMPRADVTGGYIVEVDENIGGNVTGWQSSTGSWNYLFEYPAWDNIAFQQATYIKGIFDSFETIMNSPEFNNPSTGYQAYINEASFIDFIIVQEFTKNVDGYRKSSYFYKDKTPKDSLIYAGPVWDFNLAMGNASIFDGSVTTGFQYEFNNNFNDPQQVPEYWSKLMADEAFAAKVACRYNQLRGTVLSNENVFSKIDSFASVLQQSADLNYQRYPVLDVSLVQFAPATFNVYQDAIDDLKSWLNNRFVFLDEQWQGAYFDVKSLSSAAVCPDVEVTLSVEGSVTGVYEWLPVDNIIGSTNGPTVSVIADPNITYTVTGYNNFGCPDTALVKVNVPGFEAATGGKNKKICPGEIDTLEAAGAVTYQWNPPTGLSTTTGPNPLANPDTTTIYQVKLTSQAGCEFIDSVKVTVKTSPPLMVNEDITTCQGTGVQLLATTDSLSTFSWVANPADASLDTFNRNTPNPFVEPITSTVYSVTATGGNNCSSTASVNVDVLTNTSIDFGNYDICSGESVLPECPNINNIVSVLWEPTTGLSNPTELCPEITALTNTNYNIVVTTSEGCNYNGSAQINVSDGTQVFAGNDKSICAGELFQLNAQGNGSNFSWSGSDAFSNPNISNPTITLNETTTLKVTNSGNGSCFSEDEITLTVIPNTLAVSQAEIEKCLNDAAVQLEATGGSNYLWSPATGLNDNTVGNPLATPSQTTTYTVTTNNDICVFEKNVTVVVNQIENFGVGDDLTLCSGSSGSLFAFGGVSYNWQPTTALLNATTANPTVNGTLLSTDQEYTVTITDNKGCNTTLTQQAIVKSNEDITVSNDVTICTGGQTNLNASGGTSYFWENISGGDNSIIDNVNIANPIVSPLATTLFSVNISDNDGCSFTEEVLVTVANNIIADAGEDREICAGQSIDLSASGGTVFLWDNVETLNVNNTSTVTATPTQTTTYAVTVSDGLNCEDIDEVTIIVNPIPSPEITGLSAICQGESTNLSVNEHLSYNWTDTENTNLSNTANITVSPSNNTTYFVDVSNEYNCTAKASIELTVNSVPQISINEVEPICAETSTQLTALVNDNSSSLSWSPAQSLNNAGIANPVASPIETTSYTLTAENQFGCAASTNILLIVNPLPTISVNQNTLGDCNDNQIQLIATGGINYIWWPPTGLSNPNIANPVASISQPITYNLTVEDDNSCTNSKSITVNLVDNFIVSITEDTSICRGENTALQVTGGQTYEWTPPNNLSNTNISNPIANPENTTTYTVKVSDESGTCSVFKSVTITVNNLPSAFAGPDVSVCEGEDTQLQASGGSSFNWTPNTGLSDNTLSNPTVNIANNQTYTVTVTGENGCKSTDDVNVFVNQIPTAFAGNDTTICSAQSVDLVAMSNTENVEFGWQPTNIIANENAQFTNANISQNTTIILTVTDENNCTATSQRQIKVADELVVTVNNDVKVCEGGSTGLFASGGINYEWTPTTFLNNPNISNPVATLVGVETITYTVTVYDELGCSDTGQVTVSVDDDIQPDAGEDIEICIGESVQLFAAGGSTFVWSTSTGNNNIISNTNIYNPIVTPSTTTTFKLTVDEGTSCEGYDEVTVSVVEELSVNISPGDIEIFQGQNVSLVASGAETYEWFTDDTSISCTDCANPNITPSTNNQYIVKGTRGNCIGFDTILVNLKTCDLETTLTEDIIICGETNSIQLNATGGSSYQWISNNSSLSCTNCPNPVATPTATTTYEVIIADGYCETREMVTVTVLREAIFFPESKVNLCRNETLVYDITKLSNYNLQPQAGITITNDSLIINPAINRTYTLTGNLTDGCSFVENLEITVVEPPVINLGADQFLCAGKAITLNENFSQQNVVASWSPASGLNNTTILSPVATPAITTKYFIELKNEYNCTVKDDIVINVIPNNFATVSKDITICEGGKAQLVATGGIKYSWLPISNLNDASIATPVASPASNTIYEVAVEDENGCIDKEKVIVNIGTQLKVDLTNNEFIICKDGNGVKLKADGAFSYNWQPSNGLSATNIANPVANPISSTTYTLTATDGTCTVNETVTVNVLNQSLTANAGEDITICLGETAQLKASGGLGYVWSPAESLSNHLADAPFASPVSTTTYTVVTANIEGCTDFDEVTVFVKEGDKTLSISEPKTICQGVSTQLSISAVPGYNYKWTPSNSLNDPNISNPIAQPQKSTTYQVEVTDLEGCITTYYTTIEVTNLDAVSAGDDLSICVNETVELNATGSESYFWNNSATLNNLTIPNPVASPISSTNYIVQMQRLGCIKTDTVFVEVIDLDAFALSEQITVCEGSSITISADGGDSYNWASNDINFEQPNLQQQTIVPTQQTSNYEVKITKANCEAKKEISISLGPSANYNLAPELQTCLNGKVQLSLAGENLTGFNWQPATGLNNINLQQPEATVTENISYTTSFMFNNICIAQASTNIEIIDELNISTNGAFFTICEGETQILTVSGAANYQWFPIEGLSQDTGNEVIAQPKSTTTYTVTATDEQNSCSTSKEIQVIVNEFDTDAGITNDTKVCLGDDFQLNAKGGTSYVWEPEELVSNASIPNPVVGNLTQNTQFVLLLFKDGCVLKDSLTIEVKECLVDFIPNTFTPNNDGVNDTWVIPEITRFSSNELYIYNRWGQLVYSSLNYQNDWNGTFNNTPLPEATYYYILKMTDEDEENLSGTVTIIR